MIPTFKRAVAAIAAFIVLTGAFSCNSRRPAPTVDHSARIAAATFVTDLYSRSRLATWNVRASAAGADCAVLLINVSIIMEDSMVEAMHYGAGDYEVYTGGLRNFSRQHRFRAVVYEDSSRHRWPYPATLPINEPESLAPCH
jgi:hypothetical protein